MMAVGRFLDSILYQAQRNDDDLSYKTSNHDKWLLRQNQQKATASGDESSANDNYTRPIITLSAHRLNNTQQIVKILSSNEMTLTYLSTLNAALHFYNAEFIEKQTLIS